MPDIYLYDIGGSNPADVILTNPTTLSGNINCNVSVTQAKATARVGNVQITTEVNILLYQGEANVNDIKLRPIGTIESSGTSVDVNVTGNIATARVGSVGVTGDANVSPTGSIATSAVHSSTVTGDANVTVTGNIATASVNSVSITGDANVTATGNSSTALVGLVSTTGDANVSPSGNIATAMVGQVSVEVPSAQQNSGGYSELYTGRKKSKKQLREEREALGILPKKVDVIIKEIARLQASEPVVNPSELVDALAVQKIKYKKQYADVLRFERTRLIEEQVLRIAKQREDDEFVLALLMAA